MSYLYGDSTPSTLEINFIEFLRDAVDFCVQVLAADERMAEGKTRLRGVETASAAEIVKIERLGALIPKALEAAPAGDAESAAARCVAAILRSADELVRAAKGEVGAALEGENRKRDEAEARDRESCLKALEALLIKHDLPEMESDLQVALVAGSRYACRMNARTAFGLEAAIALEVPLNHLFEKVLRVDRAVERLEVQVPEMGGWLHKEIRLRAQHLEKHHVVQVSLGGGEDEIRLRASAEGKGPGFDIVYAGDGVLPRLVRVDDEGRGAETFDVEEADRAKLLVLRDKLAAAAAELTQHRQAVSEAKLDGESLRTHAQPALVVERLIGTLAPEVQEIAARSQSPGELVLRCLLAGDRREEIFLSKQELKAKLEPLNEMHRALFQPLWQSALRPAPSASRPAPKARLVPAPGPTRPSIESAARAAAMVPPPSPTIPSFEPPNAEAFAGAVLVPPPAPPPRGEPPQQASGVIELKEVEVTFDESAPHRGGPA
ncbi:MAG TPA: hypothetical protein VN962_26220 [Polyangia bacterium]|nr:hypothetical protein [Polyangia bacterium]